MINQPTCRVCGDVLTSENWRMANQKNYQYICNECQRKKINIWYKDNPDKVKAMQERSYKQRGYIPMSENKECTLYLGVHVTERVLRLLFNDVEVMSFGNPGYDFICNKGMKVDAKGACRGANRDRWLFTINYNTTADYFLCLAFDNRTDLNPLYIWLIPGHILNHLSTASISKSTIHKWDAYKRNIDEVITCCDTIR